MLIPPETKGRVLPPSTKGRVFSLGWYYDPGQKLCTHDCPKLPVALGAFSPVPTKTKGLVPSIALLIPFL